MNIVNKRNQDNDNKSDNSKITSSKYILNSNINNEFTESIEKNNENNTKEEINNNVYLESYSNNLKIITNYYI